MVYIAFLIGCIVSYLTVRSYGQLILAYWFHRNYTTEDKYMELYARLDDEFFFDMFQSTRKTIKTYADYLRLHQKYEPKAYELFVTTMKLLKKILFRYVFFILILGVPFLVNAIWYYLPILLSFTVYFYYEIKVKGHGRLFNTLWILGSILDSKLP